MPSTLLRELTEERRRLPLSTAGVSIRAASGEPDNINGDRFTGYAACFNSRTAIGNPQTFGFYEEIAPGAFTKTLQEGDARFLIDHNPYYVVARVSAGTLELAQDKKGLRADAVLDPDLSYVNDLKANIRNKNITGMSFGFQVVKDEWTTEQVSTRSGDTTEVEVRRLIEVTLPEVSSVAFPAYEDTQSELASVALALVCRNDPDAIERRATYRPELRDLCEALWGASRRKRSRETRKAIPAHSTATTTGPWSALTNVDKIPSDATAATLSSEFAWVNPNDDPTTKSAYSFPHHMVSSDGSVGAANTVACSAGIAALNGARGGTTIPAGDKQGVWTHLAGHLKDAKLQPPPLKSGNATDLDAELRDDDDAEAVDERALPSQKPLATKPPVKPIDPDDGADLEDPDDGSPKGDATDGKKDSKKDKKRKKMKRAGPDEDQDEDGGLDNKDEDDEDEPGEPTRHRAPTVQDRMRALAKRYHLPA